MRLWRAEVLALLATVSALPVTHQADSYVKSHETCVAADNYLNAQYTVKVNVGTPPQELHVVPDTGSFEVVLSSKECTGCGAHRRFDRQASKTFSSKTPKETVTTSYGQGNVKSEAVYDAITVGGLTVPRQSILLMQTNELRDYGAASYDGVMGLGIPSVARKQDPADLAVQTSLNISTVAICFGQFDQSPGRIDFGQRANHEGIQFQDVEVVGSSHWAVDVKSVGLSTKENKTAGILSRKIAVPGCEDKCTGIIDSGTSLIAMPTPMLNSLLNQIGDVAADCSNVHTLPTLTMMLGGKEFELPPQMYVAKMEVEKTVTTSHVATVMGATWLPGLEGVVSQDGPQDEDDPLRSFRRRMTAAISLSQQRPTRIPGAMDLRERPVTGRARRRANATVRLQGSSDDDLYSSSSSGGSGWSDFVGEADVYKAETSVACVPLFMEMDMSTDLPGTPLILGIPFLRAYMARFDRSNKTIGLAKVPVGSEYCSSCDAPASMMTEAASSELANAGPASTGSHYKPADDAAVHLTKQTATTRLMSALMPNREDLMVLGGAIDPPVARSPRPYKWAGSAKRNTVSLHVNNLMISQWARDAHYKQWHAYNQAQKVVRQRETQLHREMLKAQHPAHGSNA